MVRLVDPETIDAHATQDDKTCRGQPRPERILCLKLLCSRRGWLVRLGLAPLSFVSGLVLKDMHKKDMHKAQDQMDSVS